MILIRGRLWQRRRPVIDDIRWAKDYGSLTTKNRLIPEVRRLEIRYGVKATKVLATTEARETIETTKGELRKYNREVIWCIKLYFSEFCDSLYTCPELYQNRS